MKKGQEDTFIKGGGCNISESIMARLGGSSNDHRFIIC